MKNMKLLLATLSVLTLGTIVENLNSILTKTNFNISTIDKYKNLINFKGSVNALTTTIDGTIYVEINNNNSNGGIYKKEVNDNNLLKC